MTPDQVGGLLNVSRETIDKFHSYLTLLEKWQRRINLVSNSTLADVWRRHILDSGQLAAHYPPQARHILDVGSGAGFPGLVESDQRKAVFLSTVIRELGLPAKVHNQRIELMPNLCPDVITARALAPVPKLLNLIETQISPRCVCLFLKGASVEDELTNLQSYSTMESTTYPSRSDSNGVVLILKNSR